jgi:hypothetical protein|mmetsp:Transcript_17781/g.32190  ORF Transcript_17781/g.32190 Transcript_17781/m.32190 type:complete len:203 (-) Transcript_17781:58-666(-)
MAPLAVLQAEEDYILSTYSINQIKNLIEDEHTAQSTDTSTQEAKIEVESPDDDVPRHTRVRFSEIQIREYDRIIGDHPECTVGPALALGWDYEAKEVVSLDSYEATRPPRRKLGHLALTSITRKNMMMNRFGFTEEEIKKGGKGNKRIRNQREASRHMSPRRERTQVMAETATKTLKRAFSFNFASHAVPMFSPFGIATMAR